MRKKIKTPWGVYVNAFDLMLKWAEPYVPSPAEVMIDANGKGLGSFVAQLPLTKEAREEMAKTVEACRDMQAVLGRLRRCKTANEVFSAFAVDAARNKVWEMEMAEDSDNRQRAQESILDRALGKAVDRRMSIYMEIDNKNETELRHEILSYLSEFGIGGGGAREALAGTVESSGTIIDNPEAHPRPKEAVLVPAQSGVSGSVYTVEGAG